MSVENPQYQQKKATAEHLKNAIQTINLHQKNNRVKNLNLVIQQGEFVTMLSPSGPGKITCLMMLAGFETVAHGQICIDAKPVNDIAPQKRGIGMVFQNYVLFPHLTIAENLAFPLRVRNISRSEIQQRVS